MNRLTALLAALLAKLRLRLSSRLIEHRLASGATYRVTIGYRSRVLVTATRVIIETPHHGVLDPHDVQNLLLAARYTDSLAEIRPHYRRPEDELPQHLALAEGQTGELADALAAHLRMLRRIAPNQTP